VQHEDMQRMTLDPLAAVQQPTERGDLGINHDVERLLHGGDRTHLVSDRANAADPGRDVGRLREVTPAEEGFEETRRLEDLQLRFGHPVPVNGQPERAFAFDARQRLNRDGSSSSLHGLRFRDETAAPRR